MYHDDVELRSLGTGKQANHGGDQKSGCHRAEYHLYPGVVSDLTRYVEHGCFQLGRQNRGEGTQSSSGQGPHQIRK